MEKAAKTLIRCPEFSLLPLSFIGAAAGKSKLSQLKGEKTGIPFKIGEAEKEKA